MWVQGCESQMMIGVFPLRRELALAVLAFYITCYRTNARLDDRRKLKEQ